MGRLGALTARPWRLGALTARPWRLGALTARPWRLGARTARPWRLGARTARLSGLLAPRDGTAGFGRGRIPRAVWARPASSSAMATTTTARVPIGSLLRVPGFSGL